MITGITVYEKLINWNNSSSYGLTGLDNCASPRGLCSLGTAIAQQQQQEQEQNPHLNVFKNKNLYKNVVKLQYQSYSPFQVRSTRSGFCITPSQQQEQQPTLNKIYHKAVLYRHGIGHIDLIKKVKTK